MAVKITFVNGVVSVYEFANAVKNNLKEEGFEFTNMGYSPMANKVTYHIKKDDMVLGEVGLPRKLTQQEVVCMLKGIKEIKDSYTTRIEEIEFDL